MTCRHEFKKYNSDFSGIKNIFRKSVSPNKKDRSKRKAAPPVSLRFTMEERTRLNEQTGSQSPLSRDSLMIGENCSSHTQKHRAFLGIYG
jgi:hypothetical protein